MLWILLLACTGANDSGATSCSDQPLVEIEGEAPPGWTPAAGCEVICEGVDGGGLKYSDCYLTSENAVICQFEPACD